MHTHTPTHTHLYTHTHTHIHTYIHTSYLDDLLSDLREQDIGCHINGHFVGAVIYADDITLLGPTRDSIKSLLSVCHTYAQRHDIIFNPTKTTCTYFSSNRTSSLGSPISFMDTVINYTPQCTLLGIPFSNSNILDRNISLSVQRFYCKANEVLADFKNVTCDIKSRLLSTYCLDVYGCQLWPFYDKCVNQFYVAWRKTFVVFTKYNTL